MTTLSELIESKDWPSPMAAQAFLNECEIGWGTEAGREEITRWVEVLGLPSQFLGHKLWTVEDLKEHFVKLGEYNKALEEEQAAETAAAPRTRAARIAPEVKEENEVKALNVRTAAAAWHDAVAKRKEAVQGSKDYMAQEIKKLREAHEAYERDWDKFVDAAREFLRIVRGY